MNVSLNLASFEEAAQALRTGTSIGSCHVLWHNVHWPAVAELGRAEEHKYAELQIACNSRDIYCAEPAADHTVFVHSRPGDQRRVEWLAAQTGAAVVGPPELGW
ncbi:hypothetical protein ACIBF1_21240 [Spirillospora sp. NPDC050679]